MLGPKNSMYTGLEVGPSKLMRAVVRLEAEWC